MCLVYGARVDYWCYWLFCDGVQQGGDKGQKDRTKVKEKIARTLTQDNVVEGKDQGWGLYRHDQAQMKAISD